MRLSFSCLLIYQVIHRDGEIDRGMTAEGEEEEEEEKGWQHEEGKWVSGLSWSGAHVYFLAGESTCLFKHMQLLGEAGTHVHLIYIMWWIKMCLCSIICQEGLWTLEMMHWTHTAQMYWVCKHDTMRVILTWHDYSSFKRTAESERTGFFG